MKRLYLPFLAALILLSIPEAMNKQLRNSFSECSALLFSFLHAEEPPSQEKQAELAAYVLSQQETKKSAEKQAAELSAKLAKDVQVGKVIFRSINSWNSSLWIHLGSVDNPKNSPPIIAKKQSGTQWGFGSWRR